MVEKVDGGDTVVATDPAFTSRKVRVCPSCDTVNPGDATRCGGCGDTLQSAVQDTVAATCPNCLGDRPFVPAEPGQFAYVRPDGTTALTTPTDEQYDGDCPHCRQSAYDAKAALQKLKGGDSSSWGQGARH